GLPRAGAGCVSAYRARSFLDARGSQGARGAQSSTAKCSSVHFERRGFGRFAGATTDRFAARDRCPHERGEERVCGVWLALELRMELATEEMWVVAELD